MTGSAVVMMIAICGFVWGGFVIMLVQAIRNESAKS